jgi:hypothetical protein
MFSDEESLIGMPWEMQLNNGYLWRIKNGYIFGYQTFIFMVQELKLGEYLILARSTKQI